MQRIAIILLIAIFVIAGFISCSERASTNPKTQSSLMEVPPQEATGPVDENGNVIIITNWMTNTLVITNEITELIPTPPPTTNDITPPATQPTYEARTYLNVYIPFTKWDSKYSYVKRISYKDTNTITELWKLMISNGDGKGQGRRWFIRDGDNFSLAYPYDKIVHYTNSLNYYYFDKNFDIVHAGKYAHRLKLKKFIGGVIVKYCGGDYPGRWTIGGLYQWVLNHTNPNTQGQKGYTRYNNDNLNEFMRGVHGWGEGDLSVILINVGYNDYNFDQFGVDEYYCTIDRNYRRYPEYFLGQDPSLYMGTSQYGWLHEKLNERVHHSWTTRFNYKFFPAKPLDWHLE